VKTLGLVVRWVAAVILTVIGIAAFWLAFCYQKAPLDMMQITHEEVAEYRLHKLHEVMPVSFYAEDDEDMAYVLVACPNASEELLLASLSIDMGLPLYEQIVAFMEDETQLIGDMTFSCYAFINSDISEEDLLEYYREGMDYVRPTFVQAGVPFVESNLDMEYLCGADENYKEHAGSLAVAFALIGAGSLAIAVVNIVKALRRKKGETPAQEPQEPSYSPMEDPADLTNRR